MRRRDLPKLMRATWSGRPVLWALGLLLVLVVGAGERPASAEPEEGDAGARKTALPSHDGWSDEILDVAAGIPVQQGGRVKPLLTYARFTLLRTTGYTVYRKNKDQDDEQIIGAVEWLLDCLFFPEIASNYRCIRVRDSHALVDVGLEAVTKGRKRADRYTFVELVPGWREIMTKAKAYEKVPAKDRTPVQAEVVLLGTNMIELSNLLGFVEFARGTLEVGADPKLQALFGGATHVPHSLALEKIEALVARFSALAKEAGGVDAVPEEGKALRAFLDRLAGGNLQHSYALRVLPPMGRYVKDEVWKTPSDLIGLSEIPPETVVIVRALEQAAASRGNSGAFLTAIESWRAQAQKDAEFRGEWDTIPLEVTLYSFDPLFKALLAFLIAFVITAVGWIWAGNAWLRRISIGISICGLLLLTYGVVLRCLIRGNPPVTNLYETVLFITGVGVLASLITESINKQGIALALAPVVGALGLFMAGRYEALDASDTMGSLVAVLNNNFWLATHVTTISIGYTAGGLAGFLGCFHVLAQAFEFKPRSSRFYPTLTKMIYGMMAFCLLFSLIGTILGGIWANDSWGRFWGWDPKENGALMIVLWSLITLHARLGGYIRGFGVAMCSVFGGCIVAFSWWGVNLLGVGLHSYGFTAGVFNALMIFYATQAAVLMTGFYWHFFVRGKAA